VNTYINLCINDQRRIIVMLGKEDQSYTKTKMYYIIQSENKCFSGRDALYNIVQQRQHDRETGVNIGNLYIRKHIKKYQY